MANPKPANSLENLLQRKRPAKQRDAQDSWTLDELTNAGGMHGIREFVEQALSSDSQQRSVSPTLVKSQRRSEDIESAASILARSNLEGPNLEGSNLPRPIEDLIGEKTDLPNHATDPQLEEQWDCSDAEPSNLEATNFEGSKFDALMKSADADRLDWQPTEPPKLEGSNFSPSKIHPFPGLVPPPPAHESVPHPLKSLVEPDDQEPRVTEEAIYELLDTAHRELPPRRMSLRAIRSIQDGLSRNELAALTTLWTKGREGDAAGNFRLLTIGDRTLATVLNVSDNSVRNLRNALLDKLAIQIHHAKIVGPRGGKTYIVFSYSEILRRWRKNGLILASQRTAGAVALCDASGRAVAPRALASADSGKIDPSNFKIDPSNIDPSLSISNPNNFDPSNRKFDPSSFALHIRNKANYGNQPPAPHEIARTVQSVSKYIGGCDEDFAVRLLSTCRSIAPDASIDEVEYFIDATLPSLVRNASIQSKTGVLLSRAASTFTGESLRQLRVGLQAYRIDRATQVVQRSWLHTAEQVNEAYEILGQAQAMHSRKSDDGSANEA